ncbi:SDR family NAD(P)-dependent oxidoreductase [Negadavirga shengliensis]|uniref:SDR family NAD(P)-dependent oxidoreductase n=1 Tax=Negadavirga shengliensis TaxID=1389218 RepID=A0ABV9T7V6_9BACT
MNLAITGATSGIGAETVAALASRFHRIFLLVRNIEKGKSLIKNLDTVDKDEKFAVIYCDLADLQSVSEAAEAIKSQCESLHVLINNAGGVFPERVLTKAHHEMTFSTNYLGHFLLTKKLLPLLKKDGNARVINVSSEAHRAANPDFADLQLAKGYQSFTAYANAKLFNILFTKSLAEKYGRSHIHAYALHPGLVATNIAEKTTGVFKWIMALGRPFMISARKGAKTGVFLASTPIVPGKNGEYFKKGKVVTPSKLARSKEMRNTLWNISEDLIKNL